METNRTDKEVLVKGIKTMLFTLGLMFIGPILLYIGFSNPEKLLHYPLVIAGSLACIVAIYFAFKGINTIMDSMFGQKPKKK
ncbi:DUF6095 family protein [Flavobacteriaceae bacterium A100]|uniref:DUF6095 family protein n=1 Tax=Oceanihabitans sediminis TaxID=1812012 RepID=UPI0009301DDA